MSKLFSSVQGIILEEFFFENKIFQFFLFFGLCAQIFWIFDKNFAIGLSKLHFMCPVEIFDWTNFSTKAYNCFHRLRAVRKTLRHFGAKTSKSLSKLQLMSTKNFCSKFDFWRKNFHIFFEYWSKNLRTFVKKCWVREKFLVGLYFFSEKTHVLLRNFREKVFGVRYELSAGS